MVLVNLNTQIIGDKVALVPYRPAHVPKYHEWMARDELLETTASERLSLEEEYEMQQTWARDEDKCTFILVDLDFLKKSEQDEVQTDSCTISLEQSVKYMCGDVNAFLSFTEEENGERFRVGEMEIMIAESGSRRKGIAQEAVALLMNYVQRELGVQRFEVKIGKDNEPSLTLFRDKMGFKDHRYYECFEEFHLKYPLDALPKPNKELVLTVNDF